MMPLNMYLDRADEQQLAHAVREYGNAIKELASVNIFPGDMLFKNFGVTRGGRVVFYDYDEIAYMTEINFRRIPPAPAPGGRDRGRAVVPGRGQRRVSRGIRAVPAVWRQGRARFLEHHRELLTAEFWNATKARIAAGHIEDVFPYPGCSALCAAVRALIKTAPAGSGVRGTLAVVYDIASK